MNLEGLPPDPEARMYKVMTLVGEINRVSEQHVRNPDGSMEPVFISLSLREPKFSHTELGFLYTVPWLYALYHEAGKVGVEFLGERLAVFGLDADGLLANHPTIVHNLRTYLQHNLNPLKEHDINIKESCGAWFNRQCGTPEPADEEHWEKCLMGLLGEAVRFLEGLRNCIRRIEQDESKEQILRDWGFRRTRYYPPELFDGVISEVARDFGRDTLHVVRFRTRYYDRWKAELELLQGNIDFEAQARRRVEHALLNDTTPDTPVDGKDIMQYFNIPRGPEVGKLLRQAIGLFEQEPCSKEELLSRLEASQSDHH